MVSIFPDMAVIRQQNWQGSQRVDAPHLRSVESGVAGDFDVLAGIILAGKQSVVISGFDLIRTGAVGADAEALVLQVADSALIHYYGSESGSIFRVASDRADETLKPTNSRVRGSFTPNTTNYVGIDLVRAADDATADTVQFLDADSQAEVAVQVALARTLDYKIVVSTTEFSATPTVCPLFMIQTSASNAVTSITDARTLMFRLGSGGSNPQAVAPFAWPGGRDESAPTTGHVSGDRSVSSLKDSLDAIMTRIWEIGGGRYWYSQTSDRNVRFVVSGTVFLQSGMNFYWTGTNLRWRGLSFIFDNSTATYNEILNQTTDLPGLTDLSDGQCIYVDIDRSQNLSGGTALQAAKAPLATLGGGATPGSRYVLAWRRGSQIYVRDQHYALGSQFILATTVSAGVMKASINPDLGWSDSVPVAATIEKLLGTDTATAGGISRNVDALTSTLVAGDLIIGRGEAAGDRDILITTTGNDNETVIEGRSRYSVSQKPALTVFQNSPVPGSAQDRITNFKAYNGVDTGVAAFIEAGGAIGLRNVVATPATPAPISGDPARVKFFCRTNGLASPNTKDQFCLMWWNGSVTIITESPSY